MIRILTAFAMLAGLLALVAAEAPSADSDAEQDPVQQENEAAGSPEIPLDGTLRFIIQPTILGLVPPRGPAGYGEVFVRVVTAGSREISVHYEIKEEVPLPEGEEPAPGQENMTRIRRGQITASGIGSSPAILPPLYWGDGEMHTDSALLWLSAESFDTLGGEGSCPIDLLYSGPAQTAAAVELGDAVDQLVEAAELVEDPAFTLNLLEPGLYPCVVNGERVRLPALHATDSLGLAEYWVLDDAANPLVLKLTYTLGNAGDEADLSFVRKGGGYAITSIDFSPGWLEQH